MSRALCELLWLVALVLSLGGCLRSGAPAQTPPPPSLEEAKRLQREAAELLEQGEAACSSAPDHAACDTAASELGGLADEAGRVLVVVERCVAAQDLGCAIAAGLELAHMVPLLGRAVKAVRGSP